MVSSNISRPHLILNKQCHSSGKFKLRRAIAAAMAVGAAAALMYSEVAFAKETAPAEETEEGVADLSDITVTDDPMRAFSNEPSAASFGFAKPLLETPRTVTFVSEEQLRLFGVSSVEDLSRLVPGTYTTTRFGLQGGINVRGVSADFYYRGMKRLQMQGHVRTVLSAYDNIEVIKGPPSPLYGMGQIGGYANLDPKSNRAKTGKYMTKEQGYFQATGGKYNKGEMQFGLGVPFTVAGKTSGVYVVGLLEDSDTFVRNVDAQQKFLQATMSVDNAVGPFRLEMGGQAQNSITSGNFFSRTNEDFVYNGTYITGRPLAQLDLNQDGRVGYVETYLGSPVVGDIGGSNQALDQRYAFPRDPATGNPVDISSYANSVEGIPKNLHDYLNSEVGLKLNCALANHMRNMPVAQVRDLEDDDPSNDDLLVTREIPIGFMLDPCTTGLHKMSDDDYRETGAWEREQNATQRMFYLDLVYDTNPDFTIKNQFFYDSIDSFKDSWLPYGENQEIHLWEDKITVTKKLPSEWLPDWLSVNTLGSINYRDIKGWIRSSGGDFDWRQDITYHQGVDGSGTGGFYPNTMFWTQLTNPDYQTGVPNTQDRNSEYNEKGIGVMFDMSLFTKTTLTMGARYDKVKAKAMEMAAFNPNVGNVEDLPPDFIEDYAAGLVCEQPGGDCPGAWLNPGPWVSDSDGGKSWSVSLSHKLPWASMVPYVTVASSTITLDAANNMYALATIRGGKLVGDAKLTELGIKGTLFGTKAQWTLAAFEQERTDVQSPSDPSLSAYAQSTRTEGVEASLNLQPTRKWFVGMSVTYLDPRFIQGANSEQIRVDASHLGFRDVILPTGEIYPAEAFGYGGKFSLALVDPNNVYDQVPGNPKVQAALNTTYTLGKGFGVLANIQHFSEFWVDRIHSYEIPEVTLINAGITWDSARIHLKGNVYNLMDEIYFRTPSSGDATRLSVMPDRRWEISIKIDF